VQTGDGGLPAARPSSQGGQEDDAYGSLSIKIVTRQYLLKVSKSVPM
jgi:hypothetical protein